MANGEGSGSVIVGAQVSHSLVLKPPAGFENTYQGLDAEEFPIAIPGTLDFQAPKRGYDPALLAGVPIPLQSRLLLWLPMRFTSEGQFAFSTYIYRIMWRLRSQVDSNDAARSNNPGLAGHLAQSRAGIPADNGAAPNDQTQERVVIPVAQSSIAYEQTEPVTEENAFVNLRGENIRVVGNGYAGLSSVGTSQAPLLAPGQNGVLGQGVWPFPSAGDGTLGGPTYLPFQTDAFGDEYIILVNRISAGAPTWDFAAADFGFSSLFGTANGTRSTPVPSIGIFAMHGSGAT